MTQTESEPGEWNWPRAGRIAICSFTTVLPIFLFGAFAGDIRNGLEFTDVQLGIIGGSFFASSGLFGLPAGAVVRRIGGDRGMVVAIALVTVSLGALGTMVSGLPGLLTFMLLGGAANALSQTATSTSILDAVPPRHFGLAFGTKQLNGPLASIAASLILALVVIRLDLGWRAGYLVAFGVTSVALAFALVPARSLTAAPAVAQAGRARGKRGLNVVWTTEVASLLITCTLGAAVAGILASFYVVALLSEGVPPQTSAALLTVAGLAGVAGRLFWGLVSDRSRFSLATLLAVVFAAGALSLILLADASGTFWLTVVTIMAFATAGSWPGMLLQRGATMSPRNSAGTVGLLMVGIGFGGSIGPPLFGTVVEATSYRTAWLATSLGLGLASLAMVVAVRSAPRPL